MIDEIDENSAIVGGVAIGIIVVMVRKIYIKKFICNIIFTRFILENYKHILTCIATPSFNRNHFYIGML